MKQIIRCLGCEKVVGLYKSYKVKLQERTKIFLTGEIKETTLVGRLCKSCTLNAGYKVKGVQKI